MPISLDRRTRTDADANEIGTDQFFADIFPNLVDRMARLSPGGWPSSDLRERVFEILLVETADVRAVGRGDERT